MTEPAKFDEEFTPFVVLAGKKWPIGPWAIRQQRRARAEIFEMNNRLRAKDSAVFVKLTNDEFESLILKPVFQGLTVLHKDMTFDEFLEIQATEGELTAAWFAIRDHCGLFEKAPSLGEAVAAGKATLSVNRTGTA